MDYAVISVTKTKKQMLKQVRKASIIAFIIVRTHLKLYVIIYSKSRSRFAVRTIELRHIQEMNEKRTEKNYSTVCLLNLHDF